MADKLVSCPYCKCSFLDKDSWNFHLTSCTVRKKLLDEFKDLHITCTNCHAKFPSTYLLQKHAASCGKIVSKDFQCAKCIKAFCYKSSLRRHEKTHHKNE